MIGSVERFFDPLAFPLVCGGTIVASWLPATGRDARRAFGALIPILRARPARDAITAEGAVRRIQRISEYKGIVCADWVKTPVDFVHRAACRLADADGREQFETWAREELEDRKARHNAAIAFWRHAGDVAPAIGMIGTVVGLVGMFANMNNPAAMGPAMAVAMLSTLYGLIIAYVVAGPIAARLERLSEAERAWQVRTVERLVALARAEEEEIRGWRERALRRVAG
jgi:chemotaxis protein MotA